MSLDPVPLFHDTPRESGKLRCPFEGRQAPDRKGALKRGLQHLARCPGLEAAAATATATGDDPKVVAAWARTWGRAGTREEVAAW